MKCVHTFHLKTFTKEMLNNRSKCVFYIHGIKWKLRSNNLDFPFRVDTQRHTKGGCKWSAWIYATFISFIFHTVSWTEIPPRILEANSIANVTCKHSLQPFQFRILNSLPLAGGTAGNINIWWMAAGWLFLCKIEFCIYCNYVPSRHLDVKKLILFN